MNSESSSSLEIGNRARVDHAPGAPPPEGLSLGQEIVWYWRQWPAKPLWLCLFVAWLALFHFLGNSTFGYIDTPSLFGWMRYAYSNHPDDEHGFLIPVAVVILFWWKRQELLAAARDVWWPAVALVLVALLVHIVAYSVQQTRISIIAFVLGLYGLLGLTWGRRFMINSFFPMALFVFAIPLSAVSETITYPLRILVTKISVGVGQWVLAMNIVRDGSRIIGPEGAYDVAPACSGIRSLTALGAVTMTYAFVAFPMNWKRLAILLAVVPLAVAGNVGRVVSVIVLGDVFGKNTAMAIEPYLGFVTFAVALGCLLLLGNWLQRRATS